MATADWWGGAWVGQPIREGFPCPLPPPATHLHTVQVEDGGMRCGHQSRAMSPLTFAGASKPLITDVMAKAADGF